MNRNTIQSMAYSLMGINPNTIPPQGDTNLSYINPYEDYPALQHYYLYNTTMPITNRLYDTPMYQDLYSTLLEADTERFNNRR